MTRQERITELLATRATQRLSGEEEMELRGLLVQEPALDSTEYELAAAAFDLVFEADSSQTELPDHLRAAISEQAAEYLQQAGSADAMSDGSVAVMPRQKAPPVRGGGSLPWLAAAAALVIAVLGWWPRLGPPTPSPTGPTAEPTVAELRSSLLETADALSLDWQATEDPAAAGAGGDLVWSDADQQGFMRISGLAANDPSAEQYQLWIFDPTRDDRYPVDGGVFDIPQGADEAIIPIQAKIAVEGPVLFAVTVEKPGGVVVSSRERIVLLAQV